MEEENYENLIDELTEKYKNSIQNIEYEKELVEGLQDYLNKAKDSIDENGNLTVEELLISITNRVMKLPIEYQKQKLLKDEKYNEIQRVSMEAYKMVNNLITGKEEVDKNKIPEMKQILNNNIEEVREFNKEAAKNLVSEGLLDLMFIENPKTKITSLRLGRNIVNKK